MKAIFSLVPTPSTLETSTGSWNFWYRGEHPAEAADLAHHAPGESPVGQVLDALLGAVRTFDVDTAVSVCDGSLCQSRVHFREGFTRGDEQLF